MEPRRAGKRPDQPVSQGVSDGSGAPRRNRPDSPERRADLDVSRPIGWPDDLIAEVASRQRSLITRRELLALGLKESAVDHSVRRGRLIRRHQGVYAVGGLALPPFATELAAVLAVGEGGYLSHFSAAALWRMVPQPPRIVQVTLVGRDAGRRRKGIEVHLTRTMDHRDVTTYDGIPVTRPARVLLEIAPGLSGRALERMFDRGLKERRFSRNAVATVVARNPRAPAAARVRALAAAEGRFSTVTKSPSEDEMLALVRAGGLAEPEVNVWVGPHEVDFLWRSERLIVFTDGYEFHSTRRSFEADHAQDLELEEDGFDVMRFTRDQVTKRPEWVLVRLAQRLAQLGRSSRTVD
jgi:very-short-patch-repair endonuclease